MRVGVFGGTFDPIHNGHLRVAEEIRESFSLDRVYFVPVFIPPHKQHRRISDVGDRLAMVRRAVRGNRFFRVSDVEAARGGVSYTIDTVQGMERKFGELFYLIGIDAFFEIHTWHRYAELFHHTNFVVMVRPSTKKKSGLGMFPATVRRDVTALNGTAFQHVSGYRVHLQEVTQLDISATQIRALAGSGKSIRYLVPGPVETYILSKGLYSVGGSGEGHR